MRTAIVPKQAGKQRSPSGLLIGIPISLAVTRVVSARLFGVSPTDPLTMGAAITVMFAVGAVACWFLLSFVEP